MRAVRTWSTPLALAACALAVLRALSSNPPAEATGREPLAGADATVPGPNGGYPAGWLYTHGPTILVSQGSSGTAWVGRGVNVDDVFLCGYNDTLYLPDPAATEGTMLATLMGDWKPNFLRLSLSMRSYARTASWLEDPARYAAPVTKVVEALGANPGTYVLVTLRSDASMLLGNPKDPDPTYLPSDRTNTPDAARYPTGTDAVYTALVDTFAQDGFVLFGISNEPGGMSRTDATIAAAMSHAVGTIRAEEDRLRVPHHVVAVQGNQYSADLRFYARAPLPYDNVVYELHYYPWTSRQSPADYDVAGVLPLIVGEYGGFTDAFPQSAFYEDMDDRHISNLAWDFEAFSDCTPDLVEVTRDAGRVVPTAWGTSVRDYLRTHDR
jgi:hypothetical protein